MSKSFTASLHPKSNLSAFIGKWRGRPVLPGESISLDKLVGACCTLVISHQQNMNGKTYAAIDAVSKPTKRVAPSGQYDPEAARQRYADWSSRTATSKQGGGRVEGRGSRVESQTPTARADARPTTAPVATPVAAAPAPVPHASAPADFDPEVGF